MQINAILGESLYLFSRVFNKKTKKYENGKGTLFNKRTDHTLNVEMKPKYIVVICSLFVTLIVKAGSADTIPADNSFIEYSGRVDFSNTKAPQFSYSGVSIRTCFQGTSISILLSDVGTKNFYNIILDNTIIKRIQTIQGLNTYDIASGLSDTVHEIEIYKLTEQCFGITQFHGYLLDNGKSLVPIAKKRNHIIEFIGNSITCGYGNEGSSGDVFGPTTENNYLTYGAYTARYFNARYFGVCVSGIGVYRNYGADPSVETVNCMTNYYNRTIFANATPVYANTPKPDLICVDLGTNDFSTGEGDSALYVTKYLQFIDTLQRRNKSADIICLVGPMFSGYQLNFLRRYTVFVVDSANKRFNGKVYFFELSHELGDLGYGIGGHPTVAQHYKNAQELSSYIQTLKGWKNELSVNETPQIECNIYPNPTFTKTLNYILDDSSDLIFAKLYDLQGKLVMTKELYTNRGQIDLTAYNLQNNCYVLTLITSKKTYSKIIILK